MEGIIEQARREKSGARQEASAALNGARKKRVEAKGIRIEVEVL